MSNEEGYSPLEKTLMEIIKQYEEDNSELIEVLQRIKAGLPHIKSNAFMLDIITKDVDRVLTKHTPKG